MNPLRQVEPLPTKLRWSRTRVPFVTSYCCPPNVLRTIAEVNGYAYSKTRRCGLGQSLRRQHAVDEAKRQAAEADAADEYPWDGACGSRSTNARRTSLR